MIISFDFDSTLTQPKIQRLARKFVSEGMDVRIVTTRKSQSPHNVPWDNNEVEEIALRVGIPKENIIFTEGKLKHSFVEDFDLHIDDDLEECRSIKGHLENCVGLLIQDFIR